MSLETISIRPRLQVTIDWLNPPKDINEGIHRQQAQLALDLKAYEFQQKIQIEFDVIKNDYTISIKETK